jgi:beta-lactamase regulating signal transducer with metallopeptidase domain
MIAAWIAYGLVVSGILCVAGALTERAARWIGVPSRWAWATAIGLGWALPFLARSPANPVVSLSEPVGLTSAASGQAGANFVGQILAIPGQLLASVAEMWSALTAAGALVDLPLFVFWLGTASLLLSALAITYRRLRIRANSWPERDIEGHPVRVSEDLGPAVLGVRRGQVVLPRWAVESPENHRRLIVLHEAEHLRAGDERLLFAAVIAVALMPWNLFAWWQLRRLRLAVELDCDRRVLGTGVQIREYASLLLEAGSRRGASPMTAAVFVHFHSQLGRRIREMTEKRKGPRYVPAAVALMGALVLLVAACQTPVPTDPADVQELTAGKQLSYVDPADGAELHRILEEEDGLTLVIDEVDGDTYVIDAAKIDQLKEGQAAFLLRKLKEHGDVKLTLVHEDGSETASFGTLVEAHDPASNELVEYQLRTEGELEFGPDESVMKPRVQGEVARVKEVKATEGEMKKKTEGGSR